MVRGRLDTVATYSICVLCGTYELLASFPAIVSRREPLVHSSYEEVIGFAFEVALFCSSVSGVSRVVRARVSCLLESADVISAWASASVRHRLQMRCARCQIICMRISGCAPVRPAGAVRQRDCGPPDQRVQPPVHALPAGAARASDACVACCPGGSCLMCRRHQHRAGLPRSLFHKPAQEVGLLHLSGYIAWLLCCARREHWKNGERTFQKWLVGCCQAACAARHIATSSGVHRCKR